MSLSAHASHASHASRPSRPFRPCHPPLRSPLPPTASVGLRLLRPELNGKIVTPGKFHATGKNQGRYDVDVSGEEQTLAIKGANLRRPSAEERRGELIARVVEREVEEWKAEQAVDMALDSEGAVQDDATYAIQLAFTPDLFAPPSEAGGGNHE